MTCTYNYIRFAGENGEMLLDVCCKEWHCVKVFVFDVSVIDVGECQCSGEQKVPTFAVPVGCKDEQEGTGR